MYNLALILAVCAVIASAFRPAPLRASRALMSSNSLTMEYIPDGMSKAQWAALKKKEAAKEKELSKTYGAVGITKFKSRSFEAWQKSGGKNLFPVDPSTPLEERPYMQRSGGSADGNDLKKKGLVCESLFKSICLIWSYLIFLSLLQTLTFLFSVFLY